VCVCVCVCVCARARACVRACVTSRMNVTEFQHTVRLEIYACNYYLLPQEP